jgi:predicted CoA-substrate-specific enzyme activase
MAGKSTVIGIDAGSTTAKLVRFDGRKAVASRLVDARKWPLLVEMVKPREAVCTTGYFRRKVPHHLTLTEISAARLGVAHFFPDAQVILDLGGQDTKVTDLRNLTLQMNDKCSAGTGAFLEQAARYFGVTVDGLARMAERARDRVDINSTCSVFAQSEMISVLEKGAKKEDVAAGLHHALARRIAEIVPDAERIVVIGGVARNRSMLFALSAALDRKLFVPPEPQMVNALGAAAFALSQDRRK